ncbi:MAG: TSUP family transporter [Terricaulis sp.]|nr:TSUP family transporter [Terricaulis sp.]
MALLTSFSLLAAVLITATVSGVFGMAGGIMLMGALTLALPVSAAMVTHGAVQLISNGARAVLHRKYIAWRIIGLYAAGSAVAAAVLFSLTYNPNKAFVYLLLGLVPWLAWIPKGAFNLDANKTAHAIACGFSVTGLNMLAGVAGPLLDVFFVRTALSRHQIVATKAATQALAHIAKIGFYGLPLVGAAQSGLPPLWFFIAAAPLAMLGAWAGGKALDAMSDVNFLRWTHWILSVLGVVYLAQAAVLFAGG